MVQLCKAHWSSLLREAPWLNVTTAWLPAVKRHSCLKLKRHRCVKHRNWMSWLGETAAERHFIRLRSRPNVVIVWITFGRTGESRELKTTEFQHCVNHSWAVIKLSVNQNYNSALCFLMLNSFSALPWLSVLILILYSILVLQLRHAVVCIKLHFSHWKRASGLVWGCPSVWCLYHAFLVLI